MKLFFVELWYECPRDCSAADFYDEVSVDSEAEARQLYADAERTFSGSFIAQESWVRLTSGHPTSSGYLPGETPRSVLAERPLELDQQRDVDDDADWRREMANEAGMCLGIDAYNDIMGWDS